MLSPPRPATPGLAFGAALLPLSIVGVIMAVTIMLVARFRPAWRQLVALAVVCAVAGLGAYLIVQGFLGALPAGTPPPGLPCP